MTDSFIDIHHHILYGMDDGPTKIAQSKLMLDRAHREGIGTIIATPHVQPGRREFKAEAAAAQIEELNAYCQQKAYNLRILPGAELLYTDATARLLREGKVSTLNGTRFALIEWYPNVELDSFVQSIRELSNAGFIPVVAHIERYRRFRSKVDSLRRLRDAFPMRFQMDCSAVVGERSLFQRRFVRKMLEAQLIDYVASDAHDTDARRACMQDVYSHLEEKYGTDYAQQLMQTNPLELIP